MSIKTIYTCDKCAASQETNEQFWTVGVTAIWIGLGRVCDSFVRPTMHVCRPCLESFGIHAAVRANEPAPVAPPTLEDLIIEIVRNNQDRL